MCAGTARLRLAVLLQAPQKNLGIMKKTTYIATVIFICALPLSLFARLGESKTAFENRMLAKIDGGLEYASREERFREMFELPYYKLMLIMPRDVAHSFYYKRTDGAPAQHSDVVKQDDMNGWEIHVCFYKDISVLEFYRRKGDKVSYEEVAALMRLMQGENKNAKWEAVKQNATPAPFIIKESKYSDLIDVLPKARVRNVQLAVPDDVKNSPIYDQTLARQIMVDEQRKAYELYRIKYNPSPEERKKAEEAAKKEAKNKTAAASKSAAPATPAETSADIAYGGKQTELFNKSVRITHQIPTIDDSALGYSIKLSDDSVRAMLFPDGVLFIDSRFDKMMRAELEKLYEAQAKERESGADTSILKF